MEMGSFAEIVKNYRVIFFDAYGVLKNEQGVMAGVPERVRALQKFGLDCYVLTNDASRSPLTMWQEYHYFGQPLFAKKQIISSAMVAASFLKQLNLSGKVAYLGPEGSVGYLQGTGLTPVPLLELNDEKPAALAWMDNAGFCWEQALPVTLNLLRQHDLPTIVANPDLIFPVSDGQFAFAVGSLATMVERASGAQFTYFGKPGVEIFDWAFDLARQQQPHLNKADVLMVGDTLDTDIAGAQAAGIDSLLVLSGSTAATGLSDLLDQKELSPRFICNSILT